MKMANDVFQLEKQRKELIKKRAQLFAKFTLRHVSEVDGQMSIETEWTNENARLAFESLGAELIAMNEESIAYRRREIDAARKAEQ